MGVDAKNCLDPTSALEVGSCTTAKVSDSKTSTAGFEILDFLEWGKPNYEKIWSFQKERVQRIVEGDAQEALIFCEHENVITSGRRSHEDNLVQASETPVFEIERGGDFTLHSPGQLVIYPIFKLQGRYFPKGLHSFLRFWEEVLIQVFQNQFSLDAGRFGPTGVWIKTTDGQTKKIASIGIAVRRWVTYHGISINVCNDLNLFKSIRPCNFDSSIMTSLSELGVDISVSDLVSILMDRAYRSILV